MTTLLTCVCAVVIMNVLHCEAKGVAPGAVLFRKLEVNHPNLEFAVYVMGLPEGFEMSAEYVNPVEAAKRHSARLSPTTDYVSQFFKQRRRFVVSSRCGYKWFKLCCCRPSSVILVTYC